MFNSLPSINGIIEKLHFFAHAVFFFLYVNKLYICTYCKEAKTQKVLSRINYLFPQQCTWKQQWQPRDNITIQQRYICFSCSTIPLCLYHTNSNLCNISGKMLLILCSCLSSVLVSVMAIKGQKHLLLPCPTLSPPLLHANGILSKTAWVTFCTITIIKFEL